MAPSKTTWQSIKASISPAQRNYDVKPVALALRSHTLFIIATVGVGMFCDLFLYGLIVPVLPFLLRDRIGLPQEQIQSNVSGLLAIYAAASICICPLAGYASDKMNSRQWPFLAGLFALMLSTLLLLLGNTLPVLVIARLLQGASSAGVWTVGIALAIDTVGPENMGKTIGTLFSITSVGELFAPVIGGALYKKSGTMGILALSLGILGVDFIMRLLVIEKGVAARYEKREAEHTNEHLGDEASTAPDGANHGDTESENQEQPNENTALLQGSSTTTPPEEDDTYLVPANQHPIMAAAPILYPLLHSSSIAAANFLTFTQAFELSAYDSTVPTYANELYGFDSLKVGLLFIPMSIMNLVFGPLGGWITDRYGTKFAAVLGLSLQVPVFILLRLPKAKPYPQQMILWAVLLGLLGPGGSIGGTPGMVEAGAVLEKYHKRNPEFFGPNGPYAQLYGAVSMMFNLGLVVGPLVSGELKETIGYGNMNACLAGLAALTVIVSFIWLGGPPRLPRSWKKA